MKEKNLQKAARRGRGKLWLSRLFLVLALTACIWTVRVCCPKAVQTAKQWLGLGEHGRTRAAFSALEGALADGNGVAAAFAESYQVLAGEAS